MENKSDFRPNPQLKSMDQVKEILRYYHYAYRTEETYCQWILRYNYPNTVKTAETSPGCPDPEVQRLFLQMNAIHLFMAKLIYSTGLRLMECIRLQIQDIDFGQFFF